MVRSLTVGYVPKRTGCSFELTGEKQKVRSFGFQKVQPPRTYIKAFEVFADFEHELLGPFGTLW